MAYRDSAMDQQTLSGLLTWALRTTTARTGQVAGRPHRHDAGRTVEGGGRLRRGSHKQQVKGEGVTHVLDFTFEAFAGNPGFQFLAMALRIVAQPAIPLAAAES